MPEQKLNPQPGKPDNFTVPVLTGQPGSFPDRREITLVLSAGSAASLDVYVKDIPTRLQTAKTPRGRPVKWLNNFGMKDRGSSSYRPTVPAYTVLLPYNNGAEYVYDDGTGIQPLPTSPAPGSSGQVQATLTLGDPSVGWG